MVFLRADLSPHPTMDGFISLGTSDSYRIGAAHVRGLSRELAADSLDQYSVLYHRRTWVAGFYASQNVIHVYLDQSFVVGGYHLEYMALSIMDHLFMDYNGFGTGSVTHRDSIFNFCHRCVGHHHVDIQAYRGSILLAMILHGSSQANLTKMYAAAGDSSLSGSGFILVETACLALVILLFFGAIRIQNRKFAR